MNETVFCVAACVIEARKYDDGRKVSRVSSWHPLLLGRTKLPSFWIKWSNYQSTIKRGSNWDEIIILFPETRHDKCQFGMNEDYTYMRWYNLMTLISFVFLYFYIILQIPCNNKDFLLYSKRTYIQIHMIKLEQFHLCTYSCVFTHVLLFSSSNIICSVVCVCVCLINVVLVCDNRSVFQSIVDV